MRTPGALMPGLSPRVRGSHLAGSVTEPKIGSIPACAGEPILTVPENQYDKVYPRVCGGA